MSNVDNKTSASQVDNVSEAPLGIELEFPIVRGQTKITHVQLRRPKAGELRGLSVSLLMQLDVSSVMKLLPRITQPTLLEHEITNLDPVDLVNLSQEVVDFLVSSKTLDVARIKQAEALESLSS